MNTPHFSPHRPDAGFGVVEVLLILVVVVVLGGAGWYVWQREHNANTNTTQNKTQTSTTPTPSPTPDPYAGWKTYTDSQHHYSFKYPASGWTIDANSSEQVTLLNTSKSVEVDYLYV